MAFSVANLRIPTAARPAVALRPARLASSPARLAPLRAERPSVERAIKDAEEACKEGSAEECANAWDTVEELSANASHKKEASEKKDPLDEYCEEVPDADECRVYEDV